MVQMSSVLKSHIVGHKLFTNIKGKNYAHVEGWQFGGGMLGLFPRVVSVKDLSEGKPEVKWMAEVEIFNLKTGIIVSRGFAVCSSKEATKKSFDEYAVLSMAQTRAIGKAFRNSIGWVMKLAGYEATPSEEMHKVNESQTTDIPPVRNVDVELVCHGASRSGCGNELTKQEHEFSKKVYGKPLCRGCQKLVKPIKK